MLHAVVPVAVPVRPPDAVQVTRATPTLSEATPAIRIVAAEVEEMVAPGDLIVIVGAARSTLGAAGGAGASDRSRKDREYQRHHPIAVYRAIDNMGTSQLPVDWSAQALGHAQSRAARRNRCRDRHRWPSSHRHRGANRRRSAPCSHRPGNTCEPASSTSVERIRVAMLLRGKQEMEVSGSIGLRLIRKVELHVFRPLA